jgi:hypothetical protein
MYVCMFKQQYLPLNKDVDNLLLGSSKSLLLNSQRNFAYFLCEFVVRKYHVEKENIDVYVVYYKSEL